MSPAAISLATRAEFESRVLSRRADAVGDHPYWLVSVPFDVRPLFERHNDALVRELTACAPGVALGVEVSGDKQRDDEDIQ